MNELRGNYQIRQNTCMGDAPTTAVGDCTAVEKTVGDAYKVISLKTGVVPLSLVVIAAKGVWWPYQEVLLPVK